MSCRSRCCVRSVHRGRVSRWGSSGRWTCPSDRGGLWTSEGPTVVGTTGVQNSRGTFPMFHRLDPKFKSFSQGVGSRPSSPGVDNNPLKYSSVGQTSFPPPNLSFVRTETSTTFSTVSPTKARLSYGPQTTCVSRQRNPPLATTHRTHGE